MSPTVQFFVGIAAGLTALGVIWRQAIRPAIRGGKRIAHGIGVVADAAPVLLAIAQDYSTNGGSSLRDSQDRIEATLADRVAIFDRIEAAQHELAATVGQHIESDTEAFAQIAEAQATAATTSQRLAAELKVDSADHAEALRIETIDAADRVVAAVDGLRTSRGDPAAPPT